MSWPLEKRCLPRTACRHQQRSLQQQCKWPGQPQLQGRNQSKKSRKRRLKVGLQA